MAYLKPTNNNDFKSLDFSGSPYEGSAVVCRNSKTDYGKTTHTAEYHPKIDVHIDRLDLAANKYGIRRVVDKTKVWCFDLGC